MTTLRRSTFATAFAAALAVCFDSQASAQTIYGGGAPLQTFSGWQKTQVLRQLFNCWGADIRTATNSFFPAACTAPVNNPARFAYAPVGSAGGLRGYVLRSPIALAPTPPPFPTNVVPYADNGSPVPAPLTGILYPYPTHHYSVSGSPLTPVNYPHPGLPGVLLGNSADRTLDCFYGNAATTSARCTVDQRIATGEAMVLPNFTTTVGLVANFGGVAKTFYLSRTSLCGIFLRAITNWNHPQITADNGGVSVTGGVSRAITVIVRADGGDASFFLTQALEAMCTPALTASSNFPSGFNYNSGVNTLPAWPVEFWRAPGNEGVAAAIADTPWSVGYLDPSFFRPQITTIQVSAPVEVRDGITGPIKTIAPTATPATPVSVPAYTPAAVQNIVGFYRSPTPYSGNRAMFSAVPPAPGAPRLNPVNWLNAALSAVNPTDADAYPISGFVWVLNYTCYNNTGSNTGVAAAVRAYLSWFLTAGIPKNILNANGFGILPTNWNTAVRAHALTTIASRISIAGAGATNPSCATRTGA